MDVMHIDAEGTLVTRIDPNSQLEIKNCAESYGVSYPQMLSFLEHLQSELKLPVETMMCQDEPQPEITLSDFFGIPTQPWINEPLGLSENATLKEVAECICDCFAADFEKIPEVSMHIAWCGYLLRNWDYRKCYPLYFTKDVCGNPLGSEGNHRRLVLAVGYISRILPYIPLDRFVCRTRVDSIDIHELLRHTRHIGRQAILAYIKGGKPHFDIKKIVSRGTTIGG